MARVYRFPDALSPPSEEPSPSLSNENVSLIRPTRRSLRALEGGFTSWIKDLCVFATLFVHSVILLLLLVFVCLPLLHGRPGNFALGST